MSFNNIAPGASQQPTRRRHKFFRFLSSRSSTPVPAFGPPTPAADTESTAAARPALSPAATHTGVGALISHATKAASLMPLSRAYEGLQPTAPVQPVMAAATFPPLPSATVASSPPAHAGAASSPPSFTISESPPLPTTVADRPPPPPATTTPPSPPSPAFVSALRSEAAAPEVHSVPMQRSEIADTLVNLWTGAIEKYNTLTGETLVLDSNRFGSVQSTLDYVRQHEENFTQFRARGNVELLRRVRPLASIVGKLSVVIGEGVGLTFPPAKAIFAAIGALVNAAECVHAGFEAASTAFEIMMQHLRIIQDVAELKMGQALRDASIGLLAQILVVLAVITKVQKQGRIQHWLRALTQSDKVSAAMDDLGRAASSHRHAVSSATLVIAQQTLTVLSDSGDWLTQDFQGRFDTAFMDIKRNIDLILVSANATNAGVNSIKSVIDNMQRTLDYLETDTKTRHRRYYAKELREWLKYPEYSARINHLLEDRVASTGSWFFGQPIFNDVKAKNIRTVWLNGKVGCGKSTTMAFAVHELRTFCAASNDPSLVVAHFLDATDKSQARNLREFLASMLCQIGRLQDDYHPALLSLYSQNEDGSREPPIEELRKCLSIIIRGTSTHIFIVLDALDEAQEMDKIIACVRQLREYENVTLLISSRGNSHNGLSELCSEHIIMRDELLEGDVKEVVDKALCNDGALSRIDSSLREEVRYRLHNAAASSLHWTTLQVRELARVAGMPEKVRARLRDLPETLVGQYSQSLKAINPQDHADALRLLQWLIHTRTPLKTIDFMQLMAFEYSGSSVSYDSSAVPSSIDDILALVGSTFLYVDGQEVRLSHASVADYLFSLPEDNPFHIRREGAYHMMACTCLAFIDANAHTSAALSFQEHHMVVHWPHYLHDAGQEHYDFLKSYARRVFDKEAAKGMLGTSLCRAVENSDKKLIHMLLDLGADMSTYNHRGWTVMHLAVMRLGLEIILLLLARGADIASHSRDERMTPLHMAAYMGLDTIVAVLLEHGAATEDLDYESCTPLHHAAHCMTGRVEVVRTLLDHNAAINTRNAEGATPLHLASGSSCCEIIDLLIERGASVGDVDADGCTPLHYAARKNAVSAIRLLLDRGAAIDARNNEQDTPLHLAAKMDSVAAIRFLLAHGADAGARNETGAIALHFAAGHNHLVAANLLLDQYPAGVSVHGPCALTPLHLAAANGYESMARVLLSYGAHADAQADSCLTPLHMAVLLTESLVIVSLLTERHADIDALTDAGHTPLYLALQENHLDIVALLVNAGANLEAYIGDSGFSVFHAAARSSDYTTNCVLHDRLPNTFIGPSLTSFLPSHTLDLYQFTPMHVAMRSVEGTAGNDSPALNINGR